MHHAHKWKKSIKDKKKKKTSIDFQIKYFIYFTYGGPMSIFNT